MHVGQLKHGRTQPFYHVLVDRRDRPGSPMTYVAQEELQSTRVHKIEHAYFSAATFTGEVDEERGTWRPSERLREQYPLNLEGCWLVDRVVPDARSEADGFFSA